MRLTDLLVRGVADVDSDSEAFERVAETMHLERRDFWREVLAVHGSVTPFVHRRVLFFGAWATAIWCAATYLHVQTGFGVAPYEIIGVVLALLLVIRTNSGYDRWYEGRKLWGGIVNQSRNLALIGTTYGPRDAEWRSAFLRWTAVFPHLSKASLRGERDIDDLGRLLRPDEIAAIRQSQHMPIYASRQIARLLRHAKDRGELDGFEFLRADDQRSQLIDHIGACERILKTPLAKVVSIKVRRFLFLYLLVLPFAVVDRSGYLTPILTMLVAYPLLSLDQIGIELENPFSTSRLSHLPLESICETIEANVQALEETDPIPRLERRLSGAQLETTTA